MDDIRHEYRRYVADHPGSPLGKSAPSGRSLRLDEQVWSESRQTWRGESHLMAWERILRWDPCAYCGRPFAGTVDHVIPKNPLIPIGAAVGSKFGWLNLAGCCPDCNRRKGCKSLLLFMHITSSMVQATPTKERANADHHRRSDRRAVGDRGQRETLGRAA